MAKKTVTTVNGLTAEHLPIATAPSDKRRPTINLPPRQRSRITNGSLFARTVRDARSGWSRRMHDLYSLYVSHMGGEDQVTEPERSIARRVALITVELEWLEQEFAQSKSPSPDALDLYFRGSNSLRRHLEAIGLKRANPRDITPTLDDIARDYTAAEEDE
jgi:hypothetical protein